MTSKFYPILYKKTSTGAIQWWEIEVRHHSDVSEIHVAYGQEGTDRPQTTSEQIAKGKNLGRANATTFQEQAEAEATSRWEKRVK